MKNTPFKRIPVSIWALGLVSMFMDISSEMIHSLLPLFLVGTLGASTFVVGLIEGLAESTALIVKVFSGALSDYLGKRKALAIFGYSLGALTKPLFAIAPTAGVVFTARILDRVGKGVRGAPRDALVADIAPAEVRGAAFGLRQSLDTVGAFLSGSAYPFGRLSDRMNHGKLLSLGLMVLIAADLVLAANDHWLTVAVGVSLWGLHMGITQGLLATMVADTAPVDLRGTAFGFFNLVSGIAMLIASVIAGLLWDRIGASFTFYAGAVFAALTLVGLALNAWRQRPFSEVPR